MKTLRPYQEEAINAVFTELQKGVKTQLLVNATGLGKTFQAVKILNNPMFNKVLWLTHNEELIEQSSLAILKEEFDYHPEIFSIIEEQGGFLSFLDFLERESVADLFVTPDQLIGQIEIKNHIGVIKQHRMDIDSKVVVASIQTIVRRLEKLSPDMFDLIVVDEAHMSIANTWTKVCNYFKPKLLLGLTATPTRTDGMSLSNLFEKIVFERDIKFGIDNGYLCEIDAVRVKTDLSLDTVHTLGGELNAKELENIVNTPKRNNLIVDKYLEYASGRQALAFCVDVKHAMDLAETFNIRGITASFVVGDENLCPNRKERVSLFRSKEITILTNVNILTAGVDIPDTNCIIAARPTKSLVLYMQSIGRGTRLKSDGGNMLLLDIVDNTSKHELINTWTLDGKKELEDKVFLTKAKKDLLIEKRENKRKLEAQVKEDKRIDLLKPPTPPKVQWSIERYRDEPTPAQLDWLRKLGYDVENNTYTKGQCSELISNSRPADWQLNKLQRWGYDITEVTQTQFQLIQKQHESNTIKQITNKL